MNLTHQQEVRTLLVRNCAVGIIWILALFEWYDKLLVLRLVGVLLERFRQTIPADDIAETAFERAMNSAHQHALGIGRPSFIEPEVRCVCVGDTVAEVAMRELVRNHINEGAIASKERRGKECQACVLLRILGTFQQFC